MSLHIWARGAVELETGTAAASLGQGAEMESGEAVWGQ